MALVTSCNISGLTFSHNSQQIATSIRRRYLRIDKSRTSCSMTSVIVITAPVFALILEVHYRYVAQQADMGVHSEVFAAHHLRSLHSDASAKKTACTAPDLSSILTEWLRHLWRIVQVSLSLRDTPELQRFKLFDGC